MRQSRIPDDPEEVRGSRVTVEQREAVWLGWRIEEGFMT
jgi:hypothetical protein